LASGTRGIALRVAAGAIAGRNGRARLTAHYRGKSYLPPLAASSPAWYIAVQGMASVVQFAIALLMFAGYRRSGVWGAFWASSP
jgi:hypothetical protein